MNYKQNTGHLPNTSSGKEFPETLTMLIYRVKGNQSRLEMELR
jgi:hypothetical protein